MKKKSNLWLWVKTSLLVLLVICAYSCSVMSDSEDDADKFSYLAVQMEKDGNWSIIDGDGKVIVKDEYPGKRLHDDVLHISKKTAKRRA